MGQGRDTRTANIYDVRAGIHRSGVSTAKIRRQAVPRTSV